MISNISRNLAIAGILTLSFSWWAFADDKVEDAVQLAKDFSTLTSTIVDQKDANALYQQAARLADLVHKLNSSMPFANDTLKKAAATLSGASSSARNAIEAIGTQDPPQVPKLSRLLAAIDEKVTSLKNETFVVAARRKAQEALTIGLMALSNVFSKIIDKVTPKSP